MTDYDVIVCGAGVQGLWTAKYLVEQKKKVLLLEQFPWPHSRGSSHGDSRITRYAYPTAHHTAMMGECFRQWALLENSTHQKLFVNCGLLLIADNDEISKTCDILQSNGHIHEKLSSEQIAKRFPGVNSAGLDGVLDKSAGVLKASLCLKALQKSFLSSGGDFRDSEKVENIFPINDTLIEVITNKGKYTSSSIVLTCGSWINKLLKPLQTVLPVTPKKVKVVFWKCKNPSLFHVDNHFPTTILVKNVKGVQEHFYSTPVMEYPDLMKFCCHFGVTMDPDRRDAASPETQQDEKKNDKMLASQVQTHLPNLHPEPALVESCIYTESPDKDFILDRLPTYKNIIVGTGFSGHGFKLSPVVGQILGNMALNQEPAYPIHHFAMSRFVSKPKL